MRLAEGAQAPEFRLPAIDGSFFDSAALRGHRALISFYRFASCPFCNLRVRELVKRRGELPDSFAIVAVFDSPLDNLRRYTADHAAPFPILADEQGLASARYGIEESVGGMLRGMVLRMPTLMRGMFAGYVPTTVKGSLTRMPADFLVGADGTILRALYGRDEGDHLPFEAIAEFAHETAIPGVAQPRA